MKAHWSSNQRLPDVSFIFVIGNILIQHRLSAVNYARKVESHNIVNSKCALLFSQASLTACHRPDTKLQKDHDPSAQDNHQLSRRGSRMELDNFKTVSFEIVLESLDVLCSCSSSFEDLLEGYCLNKLEISFRGPDLINIDLA